jgi:hypothetical protein
MKPDASPVSDTITRETSIGIWMQGKDLGVGGLGKTLGLAIEDRVAVGASSDVGVKTWLTSGLGLLGWDTTTELQV